MATLECPSCGRQSPGSAERCTECGLIFTPGIRRRAISGVEVGSRRRVLDLLLLAVVVIVAVVLYPGRNRSDMAATPAALGGAEPEPVSAIDAADSAAREAPADRPAQRPEPPRPALRSEPAVPPPARRADTTPAATPRPVRQPTDSRQPALTPSRSDTTPPAVRQPDISPIASADGPSLAAPPPSGGPVQRYARTWVNVRAGRSGGTALVRTLRPGEPVMVDSLVAGWYRIVVDGRTDGYVDRSYLDEAAPETEE